MPVDVALRPFEDEDAPRLRRWLAAEHVCPWFEHPDAWIEEAEGRQGAFSWIRHFVIEVDGAPGGFCQYYPFACGGEDWNGAQPVAGTYSLDYLVGEAAFLRCGVARAALELLVERIAAEPDAERVIVQPDAGNEASRALLRAAGFFYDEADDLFVLEV
nr:GNAT family N-acetyltransferase [Gordonibacter massiliensis (ex Traore et al. 2017)]